MDLRALKDRAHELFLAGRFARAEAVYREVVELSPNEPLLRLRLGDASRKAGNVAAAVSAYRTAARQLVASGHEARARAALRLALELAPNHPEIRRAVRELEAPAPVVVATVAPAPEPDPGVEITAPYLTLPPLDEPGVELHVEPEPEEAQPILEGVVSVVEPAPADEEPPADDSAWQLQLDENTVALRRPDGRGWWVVRSSGPVSTEVWADPTLEPTRPPRKPRLSVVA